MLEENNKNNELTIENAEKVTGGMNIETHRLVNSETNSIGGRSVQNNCATNSSGSCTYSSEKECPYYHVGINCKFKRPIPKRP